ncbi:PAS domain S-box protein [Hydrogenophaga sp.]|uniref:PAS domain S-box protein n=1 Tax=Hydrogenophaga sp. TaxID=1904254 RepID=UPI0035AEBD00
MSLARRLLFLPGRWLAPLMLAVFALLAVGVSYLIQSSELDASVQEQETRRLRERLSVEQSRLSLQSDNARTQLVRRLVGGMGLYVGMRSVYLVGRDGAVQASLTRSDIGRDISLVLGAWPDLARAMSTREHSQAPMGIDVWRVDGADWLLGSAPLTDGRRLLAVMDLSYPLAQRQAAINSQALRDGLLLLALVAGLAGVMHLVWFRRANRLMNTLARMGEGQLDARTGLVGGDELARIAAEADRMALRLQSQQAQIRQLADLVDRSPVVVVEWRNAPGWPVTYVSRGVSQWGYRPQDLMNGVIRYADLIHADDVNRINAEVEHYFRHGPDDYRQEYRLRNANGEWVWVEDRTTLRRDEHGEVVGISGILLDVTAQKMAELAQREQAEMLRLFYELPFIGMAISAPDTRRWLQVNDRLCEILGYSRDQLLTMTWSEMTPQPDLDQNLLLLEQVKAGMRDGYQMTKRFLRRDGHVVYTEIEVRAVRKPDGTLHRLFATVQDVTERRLANEALREQKDMLEQAEVMAGLGSWSHDTRSQDTWWSTQMYRNIGRDLAMGPPQGLAGCLACVHPDDRRSLLTTMRAIDRSGQSDTLTLRRHPDLGPARWFRARLEHHPLPGGGWCWRGTLLDITALQEAKSELERSNAELEVRVKERTQQLSLANRELEAFTYTVSHDLKAPLRGIDGYSQLLAEEYAPQLDETGQAYVARVRHGVQQMGALIADLLDYSRMERRTMDLQPLELIPLIRRVLDENSADIERTGASVSVCVSPMVLRLDREGLAVALRNLVSNALKFTKPGQVPIIDIGSTETESGHVLWVRDQGVGFDMKYHDRIFGIFQRLQRSEDYAGTGVGLALVAKAVQRMGGRVWAESQPGQGATFYMEFSR